MKRTARVGTLTALLLLLSGAAGRGATAEGGAPEGEARSAGEELPVVPDLARAPRIDGELSDEVWRKALVVRLAGYCDRQRRLKGQRPPDATEVRLFTSAGHLYLAFRCAESHPEGPYIYRNPSLQRRRNAHVLGGDYVAVALELGRFGLYSYYFFGVNPAGEVYRSFTWPHRYDLVLTDLGLPTVKGAARVDRSARVWSAEMEVPLKSLLRYPADGIPQIIGLDLRRVQWGSDRGSHKPRLYWTGGVDVEGRLMNEQYDHMATWKPLFDTYPDYPSYAAGRGWAQCVFPESFGHVRLAAGTLRNRLIRNRGSRLIGLVLTRVDWRRLDRKQFARRAKAFDAPRLEQWDDLRPVSRPTNPPRVVLSSPRRATPEVRFTHPPTVEPTGKGFRITFALSAPTDVTVAVRRADGTIVRHLAAGLLGPNAPAPLTKNSLHQEILWNGTDDAGRPLPAGTYTITVAHTLSPRLHYALPLRREIVDRDRWPLSLDVEGLPTPKHAWPLGHFAWGTTNYLAVDRRREEVYLQTRYVHDGRTGRFLRELKLKAPPGSPFGRKRFGNGEITFAPDGSLVISGSNEVWRFDREGRPLPFPALGRNFVPELWGGHSNPHRGIAVGPDGTIYRAHHYLPHMSYDLQVTAIAPDGRIERYGFIEFRTPGAGLKVDREGNVYLGCTVQPPGALPPPELARRMPPEVRKRYRRVYGSILKFTPAGGTVEPDPEGKFIFGAAFGMIPATVKGAVWLHPGFSPMLSRISDRRGGPGCNCRNGRFDLDVFGRLFIPDAVFGRIEVIDSNANTICFIGRRGRPDPASGVELGWPSQVAVSEEALYIADYLRYRLLRVRLSCREEREAKVSLPASIKEASE